MSMHPQLKSHDRDNLKDGINYSYLSSTVPELNRDNQDVNMY